MRRLRDINGVPSMQSLREPLSPDHSEDTGVIQAEVSRRLFSDSTATYFTAAILAILLAMPLWKAGISSLTILGWLTLNEGVYLARGLLTLAYRRASTKESGLLWLNCFRLGSAVTGMVWGLGNLVLFPAHDIVNQALLSFAIAGLTAGAASAYAVDLATLFGFVVPMLIPLVVSMLVEGSPQSLSMSAMVTLFLGFVVVSTRRSHKTIYENILLHIRALRREEALRAANDRLTALVEALPDAVFFRDGEGRWLATNDSAKHLFNLLGLDRQGEIEVAENPAFRTAQEAFLGEEEKTGNAGGLKVSNHRTLGADGLIYDFEIRKVPIFGKDGRCEGLVVIGRDITERCQVEQRERSRSEVLELLARNASLKEILEALAYGVERQCPGLICSILLLDGQGKRLITGAAPNLPDFYNSAVNGLEIGMGVGSCGTAAFTGKRVIVEDIQTHPYWAAYKEIAARASPGCLLVGTHQGHLWKITRFFCPVPL